MQNNLKEIIDISRAFGQRPDLIQGAGGNFSFKVDGQKMLIKASGLKMSEVSENNGLVAVDYNKLLKFYEAGDLKSEASASDFIDSCVIERIGSNNLRPSMEVGFHALLGKCVVHTHSVYANIISCVLEGEKLLKVIFKDCGIDIIWLPYSNPGHDLALNTKKAIDNHKKLRSRLPEAILAQNHGLIVSGSDAKQISILHDKINKAITSHLGLTRQFPKIEINQADNGIFHGQTAYLKIFLQKNSNLLDNFLNNILFPDQIVFCDSINIIESDDFNGNKNKILINKKNGDIFYSAKYEEALVIEEILTAWAFIIDCANIANFKLNFISQNDIAYVRNMESEKFRKNLIKK